MSKQVLKRDHTLQEFNQERITIAISKAFKAVGVEVENTKNQEQIVRDISDNVVARLNKSHGENGIPTVEEIQDMVEEEISKAGFFEVSRAYILYRNSRKMVRELGFYLETGDMVDKYVSGKTLSDPDGQKTNANVRYSMQGLFNHLTNKVISPFWQMRIYTPEIRRCFLNGEIHIHNLGILAAYCTGWNLEDWLHQGFPNGVRGQISAKSPKHFLVAADQMVNGLFIMQGEAAGAEAVSSVDTLLAPYIRADKLSYEEVKQILQGMLYKINQTTRVGGQTPFTNITIDRTVPKYMKDEHVIIGGEITDYIYQDFQDEMDIFNRALCEVMTVGDAKGRIFTFPIPTYNITKDFDWEFPELWTMTAKYGIPYFSNFLNSDMDPSDVRSMCCRLRLDKREIRRGGGLFGSNPLTGSIGVVTINMPRVGYKCKDDEEYYSRLKKLMDVSRISLDLKRKALEDFTEKGLYPNSMYWLRGVKELTKNWWTNHFSTIGLCGMNESCVNFLGESIETEHGRKFSLEVLDFMRSTLKEYQNSTIDASGYPSILYNLEATPAETTSYDFAKFDKEKFPDIIVANEKHIHGGASPFYTNSSQLPVDTSLDLVDALRHQDDLQCKYTGGTVFHVFIGESGSYPEGIKKLVRRIPEAYHLPYYSITPTFSVCDSHGYISGEHPLCPECRRKCEVYSRIVGYYRPVEDWNLGKQSEFAMRKLYEANL